MKDIEKEIEKGQAVEDVLKMDGWNLVKEKIEQEIKNEQMELRNVEKGEAFGMLVDFLECQKRMEGLERIFDIIEEFLISKKDAEDRLRTK